MFVYAIVMQAPPDQEGNFGTDDAETIAAT
jgi:hypothetical protein